MGVSALLSASNAIGRTSRRSANCCVTVRYPGRQYYSPARSEPTRILFRQGNVTSCPVWELRRCVFGDSLAQCLALLLRERGHAANSHVDMQRHKFLGGGTLVSFDVEHLMKIVHALFV